MNHGRVSNFAEILATRGEPPRWNSISGSDIIVRKLLKVVPLLSVMREPSSQWNAFGGREQVS